MSFLQVLELFGLPGGLLLLVIGVSLLWLGGEALVWGATRLSSYIGVSPLMIGLSVVAIGTTLPEVFVSFQAALQNQVELGVGNILGSNVANVVLILGLISLFWGPITLARRPISSDAQPSWRNARSLVGAIRNNETLLDAAAGVFAAVLFLLFSINHWVSGVEGVVLLLLLPCYLVGRFWLASKASPPSTRNSEQSSPRRKERRERLRLLVKTIGSCLGGLLLLELGSIWLIDSAVAIVRFTGVSELAVGIVLVAVGTSLPELATCIVAIRHQRTELAIGNILGSNITNVFLGMGTIASISPFAVSTSVSWNIWMVCGVAVGVLLAIFFRVPLKGLLSVFLLIAYVFYVVLQFTVL